jgi:hypothetical protein
VFESEMVSKTRFAFTDKVSGKRKNELIAFGEKLNKLIINKEVVEFLKNVSANKVINYYVPLENGIGYGQANITKDFFLEMRAQKGHYYNFFFNSAGLIQEIIEAPRPSWDKKKYIPNTSAGEDLDLRQYLICFKNNLKWKIKYNKKDNQYLVQFSIPDQFLNSFSWFGYVIEPEGEKLLLVGF